MNPRNLLVSKTSDYNNRHFPESLFMTHATCMFVKDLQFIKIIFPSGCDPEEFLKAIDIEVDWILHFNIYFECDMYATYNDFHKELEIHKIPEFSAKETVITIYHGGRIKRISI